MRNLAHFRALLIRALQSAGYRVVLIAPEDESRIDGQVERIDIRMDRAGTNVLKDWSTVRAYRSLLASVRPQLVLGFTPKANIYGAMAARSTGIPFVPTISGLGTAFLKGGALQQVQLGLYRHAFRHCPAVVFQNADDRDLFRARRIVRDGQEHVVPGSGIDLVHFDVRPQPGKSQVRFLFIGRMLADKGIFELAEAAKILRAQGVDFHLTLVGEVDEGNPSSADRGLIQRWQAEGLLGWVGSQSDVRPFIADADVVVLPSYREGMPRALLEAAAMGRAMVATDVPGCRDLVVAGRTGLLCSARDATSLASAMASMASLSVDQRVQMGREARALVERDFDAAIVAGRYLDLLHEHGL